MMRKNDPAPQFFHVCVFRCGNHIRMRSGRTGPCCSSRRTFAASSIRSSEVSPFHQSPNSSVYSTSHAILQNITPVEYIVNGMIKDRIEHSCFPGGLPPPPMQSGRLHPDAEGTDSLLLKLICYEGIVPSRRESPAFLRGVHGRTDRRDRHQAQDVL